jgi:hypothetical protein
MQPQHARRASEIQKAEWSLSMKTRITQFAYTHDTQALAIAYIETPRTPLYYIDST